MQEQDKKEQGFTLIELLVAIVVVGILTAVAIVGIGGLTKTGSTSACTASADAAKASAAVYYANNNQTWPTTFTEMTTGTPVIFEVPSGVTPSATTLVSTGSNAWTLTIGGGGTAETTFTCTTAS